MTTYRKAQDALSLIPDGSWIVAGPGCGAPRTLLAELGAAATGRGWTLGSGLLLGDLPFLDAVRSGELRYRTWHVSAAARGPVAEGTVGYVPMRSSRLHAMLAARPLGAALVRVSPPDGSGRVSLGPSVSYGLSALELAAVRIGEVDPDLPRTCGETEVDESVFDALVEADTPAAYHRSQPPDETSRRIAEAVLDLLPPGPVLQIGIGAIPESLVGILAEADLGPLRFAGMGTDQMVDLFDRAAPRGAASGPGIGTEPAILSPELMGSERLMRFADRNPSVVLRPSTYAHDPARLGAMDRFVSVNSALEVDLLGNVNSEMLRSQQVSGVGGSLDFVEAAGRSNGGLRIIALPSATSGARHSKIVARVEAVTLPRMCVDVVVTEHGVARLDGLSTVERAEALIAIAHPDHRDALADNGGKE
ncbi:acetyl-CoA hydrolase/transferase family protein [Frankia sp. QA3]|uniref:acetyl-CoA hydrolase/transferase family protein n=1 Tax=Frankia sp. QA3 TaxID=710111 RepID=UPI000269B6C8|nr:acetyl-CoA hydrolase/transferase C-terminal domain-containing protein [Frankia sp. QA3]EIV90882.1 acetyl-CoA hydrolase [Frankia sp. QA3]